MSDALKKLIEAVEAGDQGYIYKFEYDGCGLVMEEHTRSTIRAAFHGGLDAAKALHDSLLPGWSYSLNRNQAEVWEVVGWGFRGTCQNSPARAWLLAVLKAKLQEERG